MSLPLTRGRGPRACAVVALACAGAACTSRVHVPYELPADASAIVVPHDPLASVRAYAISGGVLELEAPDAPSAVLLYDRPLAALGLALDAEGLVRLAGGGDRPVPFPPPVASIERVVDGDEAPELRAGAPMPEVARGRRVPAAPCASLSRGELLSFREDGEIGFAAPEGDGVIAGVLALPDLEGRAMARVVRVERGRPPVPVTELGERLAYRVDLLALEDGRRWVVFDRGAELELVSLDGGPTVTLLHNDTARLLDVGGRAVGDDVEVFALAANVVERGLMSSGRLADSLWGDAYERDACGRSFSRGVIVVRADRVLLALPGRGLVRDTGSGWGRPAAEVGGLCAAAYAWSEAEGRGLLLVAGRRNDLPTSPLPGVINVPPQAATLWSLDESDAATPLDPLDEVLVLARAVTPALGGWVVSSKAETATRVYVDPLRPDLPDRACEAAAGTKVSDLITTASGAVVAVGLTSLAEDPEIPALQWLQ